MFLSRIFFDFSLFSHSDSHVDIYLQGLYRLTNLPKPQPSVWGIRLDVFRLLAKKQASQKDNLFCLKFVLHILPTKPGNLSVNRGLVNGYFIVKWFWYIYRQLDCHFKLCYCYNLNTADTFWTHQCLRHQVSYPVFSLSMVLLTFFLLEKLLPS